MSHCIEKLPHSCGTSDGLQVFQDDKGNITGYCFSCSTYIPHPYRRSMEKEKKLEKKERTPEETQEKINEINRFVSVDLPDRRLEKWALDYFGVKVSFSEEDGRTISHHYYPYYKGNEFVAYRVRDVQNKAFWSIGTTKDCSMFGWKQALATGASKLIVTEGELDAISVYQALKKKNRGTQYEEANPAVVSVAHGASGAAKELLRHSETIKNNFKELIICFDQDEHGKKATEEVLKAFPIAKVVDLPCKDANECIVQGHEKALANAVLFKAVVPKNTHLVWGSSLYEKGRQAAEWGLSWPFEQLTDLTRGARPGETYYFGAGVKMGKTELVKTLVKHFIVEHKLKVFVVSPEESNRKTYQTVLGKVAGKVFHDPKIPFDFEAYDAAAKVVGDNLCILSLYQNLDWQILKGDIIHAVKEGGCKVVVIDPITNITNGMSAGETNTHLQEIAQDLAVMAKDLEIIVLIFCHLKAPTQGDPHERGGEVLSTQFAGSRAMMRSCNYMIGLEGNKNPELPKEQRNLRKLKLLEDREFGASGIINLYWDDTTGLFNEIVEKQDE